MRAAIAAVVLALVAAACGDAATAKDITIRLRITVWPLGPAKPSQVWTLRCNPLAGTLPHRDRACYELARGGAKLFAPVPKDRACAQIYGGPAVSRVRGWVRGRSVDARFNRRNACHIERWDRVRFLFPGVRRQ